jgi:hypothetical protein
MGRQIQLSMLPADRDALLMEIRLHAEVEVVMRDGESADVQPLGSIPDSSRGTLILWNKQFAPTLQRKFIDIANPPYYRVDEFALPVLYSIQTEWQGTPALTQGRIYGQFGGKSVQFEKWFGSGTSETTG